MRKRTSYRALIGGMGAAAMLIVGTGGAGATDVNPKPAGDESDEFRYEATGWVEAGGDALEGGDTLFRINVDEGDNKVVADDVEGGKFEGSQVTARGGTPGQNKTLEIPVKFSDTFALDPANVRVEIKPLVGTTLDGRPLGVWDPVAIGASIHDKVEGVKYECYLRGTLSGDTTPMKCPLKETSR